LAASEAATHEAVARRIQYAQEALAAGRPLADVVRALDDERKAVIEKQVGHLFGATSGRTITMRFTQIRPQARRTDSFTRKHLGFDAYFDVEVTVNSKLHRIENLFGKALPQAAQGGLNRLKRRLMAWMGQSMVKQPGWKWMIPHMLDLPLTIACVAGQELTYASNCLLNIVVPVAVAVAMGKHNPDEATTLAEQAAYITATIPGAKSRASQIGAKIASATLE